MNTLSLLLPRRLFYGWWMVAAGTVGNLLFGGLVAYGMGPFFLPLVEHLHTSRGALASAISLSFFAGHVFAPFFGYFVDRHGPRLLMVVGGLAMGLGFVLLSQVSSLWQYYLAFVVLIGIGGTLAFGPPVTTTIAKWFRRRRGTALAILFGGFGVGAVLTPLISWLIDGYGWQTAAVVLGVIVWVCTLPIALVMRPRPDLYGQLPDGEAVAPPAQVVTTPVREMTGTESLKARLFWLYALYVLVQAMTTFAVSVHVIPALRDRGFSAEFAASVVAFIGVVGIGGRVVLGWLGDLLDRRTVVAFSGALLGAGVLLMAFANSFWQIALFVVLYAGAQGGMSILWALVGDHFGTANFGAITGFLNVFLAVGVVIGPTFAGFLFDATGSYEIPYIVVGVLRLATLVLLYMAPAPRRTATQGTQ